MPGRTLGIDEVNALDEDGFVAALGHVYEDAPRLAAVAWQRHPFGNREELVGAFDAAAGRLDADEVVTLLRAHPELGTRGPMPAASTAEQRGAGLGDDDDLVAEIRAGNARYRERFGFPFIIAVRGLDQRDIADALAARLDNDAAAERAEAIRQVKRIARLRIEEVVR